MKLVEGLKNYIKESTCCYYAVANLTKRLEEAGYKRLQEHESWELKPGNKCFVVRNGSSCIAFRIPEADFAGFHIVASHSDSPCFKIKNHPQQEVAGKYLQLNVEPYGGMIIPSWLDRPLSFSGRVLLKSATGIEKRLIRMEQDLLLIPNQAIHMNKDANSGYTYQKNVDVLPLFGMKETEQDFIEFLAQELKIAKEQILDYDLFLHATTDCFIWGREQEFLSGPRLDDLENAYLSFAAFMETEKMHADTSFLPVYCLYDNEEVGSATRQGAGSTFLKDVLKRIVYALGGKEATYMEKIAASFCISADNAHALHPNHPEKSDKNNACYLNAGVVIKFQAAQRYATDAYGAAMIRSLAQDAKVSVQNYANRSDLPGGSTLGNILTTQVPVRTVDIGLPQLAMHSCCETVGVKDIQAMYDLLVEFYKSGCILL